MNDLFVFWVQEKLTSELMYDVYDLKHAILSTTSQFYVQWMHTAMLDTTMTRSSRINKKEVRSFTNDEQVSSFFLLQKKQLLKLQVHASCLIDGKQDLCPDMRNNTFLPRINYVTQHRNPPEAVPKEAMLPITICSRWTHCEARKRRGRKRRSGGQEAAVRTTSAVCSW